MEKQIPQLIKVEEVKKEKIRFKVQWSDLFINMIFLTGIRFSMQQIKNLRMPQRKRFGKQKKIKAKERYITLKKLKGDTYYIRLRGGKDYGENKKSSDIHYTQWSEVYELKSK